MPDQNLVKFLRKGLAHGTPKERLFEMLRKEGWQEADMKEAYSQAAGEQSSVMEGDAINELYVIREKLESLENKFSAQDERLHRLEQQMKSAPVPAALSQRAPTPTPESVSAPPAPSPFVREAEEEGLVAKTKQAIERKKVVGIDFEDILGGNWMVKIGVAALVLGVGFFFKLAFDNNWIGPTGRIILGMIGGFALLGAGEYWQKKYSQYAQILTGGGIAILYFTIYAAHAFYELPFFGSYAAFSYMALVTLVSGALALRYDKPTIAVVGILGGFFTPFMFVKTVNEFTLLIYTIILDGGILAICSLRNWRPLTIAGLAGSFALFWFWYDKYYTLEKVVTAEIFLTSVFLIFAFATILWQLLWKKKAVESDLFLMAANAGIYFAASYFLLSDHPKYTDWVGFFAFVVAAFYVVLAYLAFSRADRDFRLTLFLGAIALVLLTIAMPIQLNGNWITIAWAVEGLVLLWLGFYLASYHLRFGGLVVFVLAGLRLAFFDTRLSYDTDFIMFFNMRFLTFAICIAAFFAASYLYYRAREKIDTSERKVFPVLLLAGNFFTLWILTAEVISFFDEKIRVLHGGLQPRDMIFEQVRKTDYLAIKNLEHAKNFSISLLWAIYSIASIGIGILRHNRIIRLAGLVLFMVTIVKVFIVDVFSLGGTIYRVLSLVGLGIILVISGYLYQRYSARIKEFVKKEKM